MSEIDKIHELNAEFEKAMQEGEDIEGVDDIVDIEFEDEEVA